MCYVKIAIVVNAEMGLLQNVQMLKVCGSRLFCVNPTRGRRYPDSIGKTSCCTNLPNHHKLLNPTFFVTCNTNKIATNR